MVDHKIISVIEDAIPEMLKVLQGDFQFAKGYSIDEKTQFRFYMMYERLALEVFINEKFIYLTKEMEWVLPIPFVDSLYAFTRSELIQKLSNYKKEEEW